MVTIAGTPGLPLAADRKPTRISPLLCLLLLDRRNRRMRGVAHWSRTDADLALSHQRDSGQGPGQNQSARIPQAEWPWMRISATPEQRRGAPFARTGRSAPRQAGRAVG